MTADIHLLGKGKLLSQQQNARVLAVLNEILNRIGKIRPLDDLDIAVFPTQNLDHPEVFWGGYAFSGHALEISLNPKHPLFDTRLEAVLPILVLHEVHHCLRYRHVETWNIGELIVLEGLAIMAETAFGHLSEPLVSTMPESELLSVCSRAYRDFSDEGFEKCRWVYNRYQEDETPHIYLIGAKVAKAALDSLQMNAFDAVDLKAELIFKAAGKALGLGLTT